MIGFVCGRALRRLAVPVAATALAFAVGACGQDSDGEADPPPDYERALADAPPPLAALYDQPNELLDGELAAYEARIEELEGYPIVVNKWASWCGPCRAEFPYFQNQAAKRGEEIAFLGIDAQDSDDAAATFLEEQPVPYPSYRDPELEISDELEVGRDTPATIFYGADGEIAYVHRGGYQEEADLVEEIEKYAR